MSADVETVQVAFSKLSVGDFVFLELGWAGSGPETWGEVVSVENGNVIVFILYEVTGQTDYRTLKFDPDKLVWAYQP
jgi:hypothetical protein